MNANADLPVRPVLRHFLFAQPEYQFLNFECSKNAIDGVCLIRRWYTANSHIRIADCLDLFQIVLPRNCVKLAKTAVEFCDKLLRREVLGYLSETDEVRKQH